MKLILIAFSTAFFFSCNGKSGGGDDMQATPEAVVNTVFSAAKDKDYSNLSKLCAPDADNDSKKICELKDADKASFEQYFSTGKISGEVKTSGDQAAVPITFGPDGSKSETINVVKKDGKWYLQSF